MEYDGAEGNRLFYTLHISRWRKLLIILQMLSRIRIRIRLGTQVNNQ